MPSLSPTSLHPLRPTVVVPRTVAYLIAAIVIVAEARDAAFAHAVVLWCLSLPVLGVLPIPRRLRPAVAQLRALEVLALLWFGVQAGASQLSLAALGFALLLGSVAVHGYRPALVQAGLVVAFAVPVHGGALTPLVGPAGTTVLAVLAAGCFSIAVAALSHHRAERLEALRRSLAARARREAALAVRLARHLPPAVHRAAFEQTSAPRSRRRWLTVCFVDLVGFTALTDSGESEEVLGMLEDYYAAVSAAAAAHGGTLDKFIGDGAMVFFGDEAGADRRADAQSCVAMALDLQRRFDALRDRWSAGGVVRTLELRVGMHSGWCTVGVFGPAERRSYTVIGTTVNTASRIEAGARAGEIRVSRACWQLLGPLADHCRRAAPVRGKGLREPVETFRVTRAAPEAEHAFRVDGARLVLRPSLVDRDAFRSLCLRALAALPAVPEVPARGQATARRLHVPCVDARPPVSTRAVASDDTFGVKQG